VDTSDAWLIDRRRRVFVNAAGPVFNFALAGILALVASVSGGNTKSVLLWLAGVNLVSVVFNLSPLLEFDGYYVLSDLTNVTRLRRKALRFVFGDLASRPRLPRTRLEVGYVAYGMAAVLYVVGVTGLVLAGVPNLVNGILASRFDPTISIVAGAGVALFLVYSLLSPFVNEVRAARTSLP
jgi:putative peptide zinc metalloprotease protein